MTTAHNSHESDHVSDDENIGWKCRLQSTNRLMITRMKFFCLSSAIRECSHPMNVVSLVLPGPGPGIAHRCVWASTSEKSGTRRSAAAFTASLPDVGVRSAPWYEDPMDPFSSDAEQGSSRREIPRSTQLFWANSEASDIALKQLRGCP